MSAHGYSVESYTANLRAWLGMTDHYLGNPPPCAYFAVAVRLMVPGLFGPVAGGELVGLLVIGRPVARGLPQDGSAAEVVRMWLAPGLPRGTASEALGVAAAACKERGVVDLYAYHDRTRHTGCCYRKAGFRKDGVTRPNPNGWASRPGRVSGALPGTSKRRWRMDLRS